MIHYTILLKTIEDFRKYVNMTVRFHIAGYIQAQDKKINMFDVLDILEEAGPGVMLLTLTACRPEELPALESYLVSSGLLFHPEETYSQIA